MIRRRRKSQVKKINPIEKYFDKITKYHYFIFFVIFASKIAVMWHVLSLIFLSPPMDFVCESATMENVTGMVNSCPCDKPVWNRSVFTETFQTKFQTHCDNSWLISLFQCKFYVGALIGSFVFGVLSDKFGRLLMYAISCLTISVFGCLVIAMPTVESYILVRCLEGVGVGGCIITAYVLCIEYCGLRHREIVTALFHIPVNIGHVTLAGVSYMLRDCDHLQLAVSVPMMLFALTPWFLMESPKWLMDSGHIDRAVDVMEKFCKFNKQECGDIRQELEEYKNSLPRHHIRLKFCKIFRRKNLIINVLCMAVVYLVCGMGYYGVSQFIGKMSGDIHANVAISGAMLLPGTLASICLLKLFGRRSFLMGTNFLSGLFMLIVICIPSKFNLVRVLCACFCNTFFFISFLIAFLYSVELFPTSVRSSVLGLLSVLSRFGQILGPIVNSMDETAAGAIFGVLAIFGGVVCYPLPETKNIELPSAYEEAKLLTRRISQRLGFDYDSNEVGTSETATMESNASLN